MNESQVEVEKKSDVLSSQKPNWFDDDGELSFYVQNMSDGDVILSDIGVKVPLMGVSDLREFHDIERLKKSTSLRQAMSDKVGWLKRINLEMYQEMLDIQQRRDARVEEQKRMVIDKKQNEAIADENQKVKETKLAIGPKTLGQVEKLRLFYNKKTASYTPEDFLMFVKSTKLTDDEKGYIMSVVKEKEIQEAVLANTK